MRGPLLVIEGLPAMGKTTIADILQSNHGFKKVNESLGHPHADKVTITQQEVFEETVEKYRLAELCQAPTIIDRGYLSLIGWDYCTQCLGYAHDLAEKQQWVYKAIRDGIIREPELYVYLDGTPALSLARRPRPETKEDVWSGFQGMELLRDFYEAFFPRQPETGVIRIDATSARGEAVGLILSALNTAGFTVD